ncbi:MAG: hypothetical protein O2892_17600, partial [Actinomycetota bacterium]|nr:hypothetical protein [Actinomycetota bacterium]
MGGAAEVSTAALTGDPGAPVPAAELRGTTRCEDRTGRVIGSAAAGVGASLIGGRGLDERLAAEGAGATAAGV